MAETTDNPHDRYFKEAFSQIDILNDFLNIYLPDALRQAIDFSSVRRDMDTFTDESLSEHFADLIFTATLDGQPTRIALLLEHKSYTEPHIHFQLNRYMLNVWEQQLTQKKPLLAIIPIVVYHGHRRWKKKPITDSFRNLPPTAQPYLPQFDYVLIDLSTVAEKLPDFATDYARLTGVLLQNSRQKRALEQGLLQIADGINRLLTSDRGERFFQTSLIYLTWITDLTKTEIVFIFRNVSKQAANYNMSLYEQLIQEGLEQGIEQGIEQGVEQGREAMAIKAIRAMLNLGLDTATIASALDLPVERVDAHKRQLSAEE